MEIRWSEEKNRLLKKKRGVCFEQVIELIDKQDFIGPEINPNHQHQRRIVIKIDGYPYVVPLVIESDGTWFLKTMYPSRKMKGRLV